MSDDLYALKYPVGKFQMPEHLDEAQINQWIEEIDSFPEQLNDLIKDLSIMEMYWKYRPNGWSVKQVVHHCADSHMNSFIRFKLALTEDNPTIRPYYEDRWAAMSDGMLDNVMSSMHILKGLHARWSTLLQNLSGDELNRTFVHPEHGKVITVKENIGTYAWHCRHHLVHIKQAIEGQGKYN